MTVQHINHDTTVDHKPATETYNVDGVVVEANIHWGICCHLHGSKCEHVDAVQDALAKGKVPALESWDRAKHWG